MITSPTFSTFLSSIASIISFFCAASRDANKKLSATAASILVMVSGVFAITFFS
jgi:hypothetical protein